MIKGTISKEILTQKILENFEGSFIYNKELRIPFTENGEEVQIKVSLTCAKVNVDHETSTTPASPVTDSPKVMTGEFNFDSGFPAPKPQEPTKKVVEMTEAEKDNVAKLLARLGY